IYWKKSAGEYKKIGFIKDVEDDNKAMELVAKQLQNVVDRVEIGEALLKLSKGYILKLLHTYHPNEYFPVNNEKCINNLLKLMQIDGKGRNVIEKNRLIQEFFLAKVKQFNSEVSNTEFSRFLFEN